MKIYVVDDDPMERMIVLERLSDQNYDIHEFANATDLLAAMDDDPPDMVLLDIEMPGMNGIDACRAMRALGHDQESVVFVSAHDDMATRMAAYDAGGDDYIVKPYFAEELARKVKLAESSLQARKDMASQARFAQQTAFTAMSSMGEMGLILEFLRQSFDSGIESLAERVFNTLRQFGLEGLARIEEDGKPRYFSSKGPCSPIETSILDHAKNMDRIFQFRDRVAINYPHITIMALNLPLDDPDRVGRIRDHLAILIEGASARVEALDSERRRNAQSTGIVDVVADLSRRLDKIDQGQAHTRLQVTEITSAYMDDLMRTFVHLGLSEDQERLLTEMAQHANTALTLVIDEDRGQSDALRDVVGRLRDIAAI